MRKGFTLIELLAVILILGVIALIAVPTVSNIIEDTEKGAAEQSVDQFVIAVERQIAVNQMNSDKMDNINDGIYDLPLDPKYKIKLKGQNPSDGWIDITKNRVNRYSLVIGKYVVSYNGTKVTVKRGSTADENPFAPKNFSTDSWEVIINAVKNNNLSKYNVGDIKEINMESLGTHTVRIVNTSTPSECSTTGFSQTACGFVLEFIDIITEKAMNSTNTDVGGWPATKMREYVNSDIYNSLPSDLKSGVAETFVVSGHGTTSGETNFTSIDKLYLLSTKEVYGKEGTSNIISYDTAEAETRQLDYYKNNGITTSNYSGAIKKRNGVVGMWWLRAAHSRYPNSFCDVFNSGESSFNNAIWGIGVSPAFRIG